MDAKGVELLTKQVNVTDRKGFDEEIANLGSEKSKAEAIAAQTSKTINEKMQKDPEFYKRFSKKIAEIIEKMRQEKLADVEALKQMKLIHDEVINKKDSDLPEKIKDNSGAGIFYRNLADDFKRYKIEDGEYLDIVVSISDLIKNKTIVDWHKNSDVKRRIANSIDDYLYDDVRNKRGLDISNEAMQKIVKDVMTRAENNVEDF